MLVNDNNLH